MVSLIAGFNGLAATTHAYAIDQTVTIGGPGAGGLFVLDDGTAIHWGNQAHIRVRSPKGDWIGFTPPETTRIDDLVPDKDGMLLSGAYDRPNREHDEIVLLIDRQGRVLDRWRTGKRFLSSIFSDGGRRWATFYEPKERALHQDELGRDPWPGVPTDPLVELLPGGKFEEGQTVDPRAKVVSLHGGHAGNNRVDCIRSDESMQHYHAAYCMAAGRDGWREIGQWTNLPPFVCGSYLIEIFEGYSDRRAERPRITVRRLDNGAKAGTRTFAPDHAVACGVESELLVGKTDVQGLSLPSLRTVWRLPSPHGRVVALARDGDHVLAATPSGTVFTLSPPTRKSDRDSKRPAR